MPCYHPISAWQLTNVKSPTGKSVISFDNPTAAPFGGRSAIQLPCGQCVGCRIQRSKDWAIRCWHEASLYEKNCFITLTYNDDNLPPSGSLHLDHFQKFMKRFRKRFGSGIRFFHCGEYGDKFQRPHYHALIFNFDFPPEDKTPINFREDLFRSKSLEELWDVGFSTVGALTFESAAYCARYALKKINGDKAAAHYTKLDEYGEEVRVRPEYVTMSRRPGIASGWFKQYQNEHNFEVYPDDFIVYQGIKMKVPRFYDSQYEHLYPDELKLIKEKRIQRAKRRLDKPGAPSLKSQELVAVSRIKNAKRSYEENG